MTYHNRFKANPQSGQAESNRRAEENGRKNGGIKKLTAFILAMVLLTAGVPQTAAKAEATAESEQIQLCLKASKKISDMISSDHAANSKVIWESSDPDVVTVKDGTIRGKAAGDAVVSAEIQDADGSTVRSEFPVHVYTPVSAVKCTEKNLSVYPGQSAQLTVKVEPLNAEYQDAIWSSSDPAVAAVHPESGEVTGKTPGKAVVTLILSDPGGDAKKAKKLSVNVSVLTKVSGFTIKSPGVVFSNEKSRKISVNSIDPANASNKKFRFTSSDDGIIRIDKSGKIKPGNTGCVTIEAEADDQQGARQNASIWCLGNKTTITGKKTKVSGNAMRSMKALVSKLDELKKTSGDLQSAAADSEAGLTAEKIYADTMSVIALTYLAGQSANRNKNEAVIRYTKEKPSYCFISENQIWCCFAMEKSSGYEAYGFIRIPEDDDYLTHIKLYSLSKEILEKRFNDRFEMQAISGEVMYEELLLMMKTSGLR